MVIREVLQVPGTFLAVTFLRLGRSLEFRLFQDRRPAEAFGGGSGGRAA